MAQRDFERRLQVLLHGVEFVLGASKRLVKNKATMVAPPDMKPDPEEQTAVQKHLDGPPASRRVGDVVRQSDIESEYALTV